MGGGGTGSTGALAVLDEPVVLGDDGLEHSTHQAEPELRGVSHGPSGAGVLAGDVEQERAVDEPDPDLAPVNGLGQGEQLVPLLRQPLTHSPKY